MLSGMRWSYRCRTIACWACARSRIVRKAARLMTPFAGADNQDCSFATICLSRVADVNDLTLAVREVRKSLRNMRDYETKTDRRWAEVGIHGSVEIDAVDAEGIPRLPPQRRALIPALPAIGQVVINNEVIWLPHLHASVHHPGLERGELLHLLRRHYPGEHRVDVSAFRADTAEQQGFSAAEINAYTTASYALSQSYSTKFDDPLQQAQPVTIRWPTAWQAIYHDWIFRSGRSLQALQISINRKKPIVVNKKCDQIKIYIEPMPCVF